MELIPRAATPSKRRVTVAFLSSSVKGKVRKVGPLKPFTLQLPCILHADFALLVTYLAKHVSLVACRPQSSDGAKYLKQRQSLVAMDPGTHGECATRYAVGNIDW